MGTNLDSDWILFVRYYDDDSIGSIMLNQALAAEHENLPSTFIACAVDLKSPSGDGLLTGEEIDGYQRFDEALYSAMEEHGAVYTGRIVSGGKAVVYIYGDLQEETLIELGTKFAAEHGYDCQWANEEDPEHARYWTDLYPVRAELRRLADEQLIETLEKAGDRLDVPRQIDHWAYFSEEVAARAFTLWAEAEGFKIEEVVAPTESDGEWQVHLSHDARPAISDVGFATNKMDSRADELGGRYDGWEAFVIREDA